jgi:elongation factor G
VGKLGIFRVHQGTVTTNSLLYVGDGRKPFKATHLYLLQGKEYVEVPRALPGDIVAVPKIDEMHFDAVLHDAAEDDHIHLKPLDFPVPVHGLAIGPKRHGDEQRMWEILTKLIDEDPCLKVEHVASTNETILYGLGELHLRVLLERLRDVYKFEVVTRPPRIAYRETITAKAEGHHRHKKQTGGAGQFGEVFLKIEPLPRGTGFEFVDAVKGGTIPGQYMPAVEKGVRQVLQGGAVAGYQLQDVRVIVYDGKYHTVDSKEVAFVAAGKKAFLEAITKARPQILEPIVNLEVSVPEAHMGDITGGLASKRAKISGTDSLRDGEIVVRAQVPLSELTDYAAELKGATAGRGRYEIEFSHYEPVPGSVQKQLMDAYKPHHEED